MTIVVASILFAYSPASAETCHATHFRGYADIDDIRMYYEIHGDGDPVLLLHGGTFAGAESWSRTIPAIARKYQVIVPDSRAHGRSTDSDKPLGYDLLTDNIVELMDHLQIQNAHVVGWSDGGVIGFNLALRYPDRLGKLVAYGANFHVDGLPEDAIKSIEELGSETWQPWIAELMYLNIAPIPENMGTLLEKVRAMWLTEPTWRADDLEAIDAPVLILEDSLGKAIKPEHTQELVSAIPNARLHLIDDTDHQAPQVQSETFNTLVLEFLSGPD